MSSFFAIIYLVDMSEDKFRAKGDSPNSNVEIRQKAVPRQKDIVSWQFHFNIMNISGNASSSNSVHTTFIYIYTFQLHFHLKIQFSI